MRVVIPMSGLGRRFEEAGYNLPKPLIKVDGKPIIEHLLSKFPVEWPKTFICNHEHLERTPLRRELHRLAPHATLIAIQPHKKGPVFAVLEALRLDQSCIPVNEPCIVNYCDFSFSWDSQDFERFTQRTACDGAVLCYRGFHPEYLRPTLYAYCREENGRILEIKEKGHFTQDRTKEFASSGTYYFRSGAMVRTYFQRLMEEGPLLNGEGYVSVVYQKLLADQKYIAVYEVPYFLQWGTPQDLQDYEYWAKTYHAYPFKGRLEQEAVDHEDMQLLMPMAGLGSRFGIETPKPLIQVLGKPMFLSALQHLPACNRHILVVRKGFQERILIHDQNAKVVALDQVTEGQAITCELAVNQLEKDKPVFVSSCDHGMVWNQARWKDQLAQCPDLIVWGQRNYPGADRTAEAFAYIETEKDSDRIRHVSVKEPLDRQNPRKDLLLVGTFYFGTAKLMLDLIAELKRRNLRIKNEFYLDSVVNFAIEQGLDVRVFEADGYLCWGTPEALDEFNYWHSYFTGRRW
ncbi:MAG: NTP transferase domain-containing protein [Candidatus Poribacteria bacterium]